jgi:cation:H+ antiporter
MLVQVALFVFGLMALVIGAESLVRGASRLALGFGMSPLVIGLTIVSFGTSAPEIAVSVGAALKGTTDIAIGNVVGSNIFNVLFILGISALVTPLVVNSQLIRQEVPVMIGVSGLLILLALDGNVGHLDAGLLFTLAIAYTVFLVVQSRRDTQAAEARLAQETPQGSNWDRHWTVQVLLIVGGLALLVLGARWLVGSAVAFAKALGVSDVIIGLTIVAAGTSLPEVATSVMAAIRGERDIAVGNVVGSNIFNILACLGLSGLAAADGLVVAPAVLNFDLWVMLAVAVACLPIFFTGREIARWEGGVFFAYYAAYAAYVVLAAQQHDALQAYSRVMLVFVIPLTALGLGLALLRQLRRPTEAG